MPSPLTIAASLRTAAESLSRAGIADGLREAKFLLAHHLGCSLGEASLLAHDPTRVLPNPQDFQNLIARRAIREPAALITGTQGFWTLDLAVSPSTLIPRADSETLIEAVLQAWPDKSRAAAVLDLGTGTGCLLLSVLAEYPAALGTGIDRNPAAAQLARANAQRNGLLARGIFLAGDWATAINARFDLVLSNPPYIPSRDLTDLMPEVRAFEPAGALDGGADGLTAYRAIIAALPALLTPGGIAVLELGQGQEADVAAIARQAGFQAYSRNDLGGIPRALILRRPEGSLP